MEYIDLIGSPLKSDFLLDLFETYDVDVIYRYDRHRENILDEYVAEIPDMGLEFLFDSSQQLTALFMKKVVHSGFNPFEGTDPRFVPFQSGTEAMEWAEKRSISAKHQEQQIDTILGVINEWVKFSFETYSLHYQFQGGSVSMVTIMQSQSA